MGRVRTKTVKKSSRQVIEKYSSRMTLDFHTNKKILEEVVSVLTQENGVTVELRFDIQASAPNGLQPSTIRAVSENCRTLKITNFGFVEE